MASAACLLWHFMPDDKTAFWQKQAQPGWILPKMTEPLLPNMEKLCVTSASKSGSNTACLAGVITVTA